MRVRNGEAERLRQKEIRDRNRANGLVKLQVWIKIEHKNKIKDIVKILNES